MSYRDRPSFFAMCRAFPYRTALFTFGPMLVGLAQLINAYVHGSSVLLVGAVAAVMLAFSVLITRYHLVRFRIRQLEGGIQG